MHASLHASLGDIAPSAEENNVHFSKAMLRMKRWLLNWRPGRFLSRIEPKSKPERCNEDDDLGSQILVAPSHPLSFLAFWCLVGISV